MTYAHHRWIETLLRQDGRRWQALRAVSALDLPQGCIGAGFLRNLIWDRLHGFDSDCRDADVDVIYHDTGMSDPAHDRRLEDRLRAELPDLRWSVRNQARMHRRNGDAPYASVTDAMRHWPETATAVAGRLDGEAFSLIAPFGTEDVMGLILRPTSDAPHKRAAFAERLKARNWLARWPRLRLA